MFEDIPKKEKIKQFVLDNQNTYFPSEFGFLKAINGIRPGMTHGLLAPASMGKSTLTRSIIAHTSQAAKCGIFLSEEKATEYIAGFYAQGENAKMENIVTLRESDLCKNFPTKDEQIEALVSYCLMGDVKVLFWDNITTGKILGDSVRPNEMARLFEKLKDLMSENGIALFYVAHTGSTIRAETNVMIQGEDIRGSRQIYMQTEYFFTLQVKTVDDIKVSFVNISKCRFHQPQFRFYALKFSNNKYISDQGVAYSHIQKLFEKKKGK